jgi:hypothetical protein
MDYPQLNFLFGLCLILAVVVNIGLRVLLSKLGSPVWWSSLSWLALAVSIVSALYIEYLFLQRMTPAFNRQIGLGWLIIGGIGALVTTILYRRVSSSRLASVMFVAQILASVVSLVLAYGLYRSLVPISPP